MAIKDNDKQFNFNAQAALIYYVEEILNKCNEDLQAGGTSGGDLPTSIQNKKYNNFVTIRSQKESLDPYCDKSSLVPININSLINKDKSFSKFFSRFPEILKQSISCNIEIYKTFIYNGQEYDWRVPLSKGMAFDYINGKQKPTSQILDEISQNKFLENNVANSSFNFEYKGINEFDISTNLEATLELVFDDPTIITKKFNTLEGENLDSFMHIPLQSVTTESFWYFSFADLISNVPYDYDVNKRDLNNYRIKALVKFIADKTIYDMYIESASSEAISKGIPFNPLFKTFQEFQNVLNKCSVILYLTPHSHDLTVGQDNKLSIKINYVASSHGLLHSPEANILNSTGKASQLEEIKKQFDEKIKDLDQKKENHVNRQLSLESNEKAEERRKKIEEDFKESEEGKKLYDEKEKLELQLQSKKAEIYSDTIKFLIANNLYILKIPNESLNLQTIKFSEVSDRVGSTQSSSTEIAVAKITKTDIINNKKQITYFKKIGSPLDALMFLGLNEETAKQIINGTNLSDNFLSEVAIDIDFFGIGKNTPTEQQIADLKKQLEEAKKLSQNSLQIGGLNASSDEQVISFIFLGDLLNRAFLCLKNIKPAAARPKIFLGPVQIAMPISFSSQTDENGKEIKNVKKITVNLADIPISFNLLTKFWSSIVEAKPDTISVHTFLYELVERLLRPVLGPEFFEQWGNINNKLKIGSLTVNLPNGDDKTNIFTNQDLNEQMLGPISKEKFIEGYEKAINNFDAYVKNNGTSNYIFLFDASNHNVIGNNGDFDKDLQDGIYHFTLNTGGSLIKKINFSRLDMVGLREGLAVQEGSNKNLLALKQAYKIDIDLMPGLTIYKPGDIVFVQPYIFQGDNKITELSNTLGFIGYYMITSAKYNWGKSSTDMSCNISGKLIAWLDQTGKSVSVKGN